MVMEADVCPQLRGQNLQVYFSRNRLKSILRPQKNFSASKRGEAALPIRGRIDFLPTHLKIECFLSKIE